MKQMRQARSFSIQQRNHQWRHFVEVPVTTIGIGAKMKKESNSPGLTASTGMKKRRHDLLVIWVGAV
jgi:hypothetical protein